MKKHFITGALSLFLLGSMQPANAFGLFYTEAQYPVTATGADTVNLNHLKRGESSALGVLGLVEVGNAGIYKAAKKGRINKVHFIDVKETTVLFFFRKIRTIVYGE